MNNQSTPTSAATAAATAAAPAADPAAAAADPAVAENLMQDDAADPAAAAAADPAVAENLMQDDDADPAAAAADPAAADPAVDDAAVAAATTAISAAITPVDIGLGLDAEGKPIGWDGEAVTRMAGVCAKAGVKPEAAQAIVQAYADHYRGRITAERQAEAQLNASMVAETRAAFGGDLKRVIGEARRGGEDVFGKDLWSQLVTVPFFANDKRIISALAARGRAVTTDSAPGGAGTGTDDRDLASRLYGSGR